MPELLIPLISEPAMLDMPVCRKCGCWEYAACYDEDIGPCWWSQFDLCSFCSGEAAQ